jgi:hypothetical protein
MILFNEDWKKHPGAKPDFTTKNKSFIRVCSIIKQCGVKNHTWPLALLDQSLKGVDPFNPDLTTGMKYKIGKECFLNPIYWLRECARAPGSSGLKSGYIKANRGLLATWWLYLNHIIYIHVQPRQTGKSFGFSLRAAYLSNIGKVDSKMGLLTRSDRLRTDTIEMIRLIDGSQPPYLSFRGPSDSRNNFCFTVKAKGNKYTAYLPSMSEKTADALGRGFTIDHIDIDELSVINNLHITLPVLLSSSNKAQENAAEAGAYYGISMMLTAGSKKTPEGRYAAELQDESAVWSEAFYDAKNLEHLKKIVRTNSRGTTLSGRGVLRVNCTFNHRQLGKTDQWLIDNAEKTNSTGDVLLMDYFNIWSEGSTEHPLVRSLQEKIARAQRDPLYVHIDDKTDYSFRWYVPESEIESRMSKRTIICVDSSEAIGEDDIGLLVCDPYTGDVLCAATFNYTSLSVWVRWLFGFMILYENTILIMEMKSTGPTFFDILVEGFIKLNINPFTRIFNRIVNDKQANPDAFKEMELAWRSGMISSYYVKVKRHFGFRTSGGNTLTSRRILFKDTLLDAANNIGHLTKDKKLIDQILGLRKKNGRVDHQPGQHDDLVICWLLFYFMVSRASNIDYYGISPQEVLTSISMEEKKNLTPEEEKENAKIKALRKKIKVLKEQYAFSRGYEQNVLKRKIIRLSEQIPNLSESDQYHPKQIVKHLEETHKRSPRRYRSITEHTYF